MRYLILGLLTLPLLALFAPRASACDTLQTFRTFRAPAYAPACDCETVLQAPVYAPQVFAAPVYAPMYVAAPAYVPSCGVLQAPVYHSFAAFRAPVYRQRAFAVGYGSAAFDVGGGAFFERRVDTRRGLFGLRNRTTIQERSSAVPLPPLRSPFRFGR